VIPESPQWKYMKFGYRVTHRSNVTHTGTPP